MPQWGKEEATLLSTGWLPKEKANFIHFISFYLDLNSHTWQEATVLDSTALGITSSNIFCRKLFFGPNHEEIRFCKHQGTPVMEIIV